MSLCREWYETFYERLERRIMELEGNFDKNKLRRLRKLKVILNGHYSIGEEIVLERLHKNDYSEVELSSDLKKLEDAEDLVIQKSASISPNRNIEARKNFIAQMVVEVSGVSSDLQYNSLLDYFENKVSMIGFDIYFDSLLILAERAGREDAIRDALERINFGKKVLELYTALETTSCYEKRRAKESDDMRDVVNSDKSKNLNLNKAVRLLLVAKKLGSATNRDYFCEVIYRPEVEQLLRKRRESKEWCEKMDQVLNENKRMEK